MILHELEIEREAFERGTGWSLEPEGACKGDVCVPLADPPGDPVGVEALAAALGMPLVNDAEHDLWALGPASIGARALTTAQAPNLTLPDLDGRPFALERLRGRKVLIYAWAPY